MVYIQTQSKSGSRKATINFELVVLTQLQIDSPTPTRRTAIGWCCKYPLTIDWVKHIYMSDPENPKFCFYKLNAVYSLSPRIPIFLSQRNLLLIILVQYC